MIIYRSFYEAIKDLQKQDQADVWNAIYSYALDFKEVELKGIAKTVFTLIKPQLDANITKYKNGKKNKQSRSKTEANQELKKANDNQDISKAQGNVNVNVNENHNEESHNEIFRNLWNNRIWLEQLAMKWKVELPDIRNHLNDFRMECLLKDEIKVTEKDAKEHFINWVKKGNPVKTEEHPKKYVPKNPSLQSLIDNDF